MENQSSFKMRKINNITDMKSVENGNLNFYKENDEDKLDKIQIDKKKKHKK